MTDDEHDLDCPVCEAKRDIVALLRNEAVETLREIIAECRADLAGGEDADAQVTIMACSELLQEMGEPVEQKEGKLH